MVYCGEVFLNISYSVLASVIFFFVNDFYPKIKIKKVKKDYFNENRKEIRSVIGIYIGILEKIKNGEIIEKNQKNNLRYCYVKIETFIRRSFELYQEVIPHDLYKAMNSVINNSLLEIINSRLNGKVNEISINELIYSQPLDYKGLVDALNILLSDNKSTIVREVYFMSNRNYGIDTLRIISMLMIVVLHVLGMGGLLEGTEQLSLNYELVWLMEIACYCAVNCYALISGYVMCNSKIKYYRIVELWLQVLFYSFGITLLFFIFNIGDVGTRELIVSGFPVVSTRYWYFTAYFGMFFFIPVLNHIVNTMKRRELEITLISCIGLFSILPLLSLGLADPFKLSKGYSMLWLMVMYLMGGYIRKYDIALKINIKKSTGLYVICVLMTFLSKLVIEVITIKVFGVSKYEMLFVSYVSPTIVFAGIGLFLCFVRLEIKNRILINMIKWFAPVSFGVYLIHTNPVVFNYIVKGMFKGFSSYPTFVLLGIILVSVIAIYVLCSGIDWLRLMLFHKLRVNNLCKKIVGKIEIIINRIGS